MAFGRRRECGEPVLWCSNEGSAGAPQGRILAGLRPEGLVGLKMSAWCYVTEVGLPRLARTTRSVTWGCTTKLREESENRLFTWLFS
jgi:hypothetical protein